MRPDHGISDADLETIRTLLAGFADEIAQVDLFGSRATGTHRPNSDLDLVLRGRVRETTVHRLWTLFHESRLPVSVDVIAYEGIRHEPLRRHVDAVARCLFTAAELRNTRARPSHP